VTELVAGVVVDLVGLAVRWVSDEPQPGLVLVEFTDAGGQVHQFTDKTAMFDDGSTLLPSVEYPIPCVFRCEVLEIHDERVVVRLFWVESHDGEWQFEVRLDSLRPVNPASQSG
jgi:hypothetical protein